MENKSANPKLVQGKDLVKGHTYYLTNNFWPDGGKPVRVKRWIPAREEWRGERGMAAIVKGDDDKEYIIHPRIDELFTQDPFAMVLDERPAPSQAGCPSIQS